MFLAKLKLLTGLLLAAGALGAGIVASGLPGRTHGAGQADARKEAPPKGPAEAQPSVEGRGAADRAVGPRGVAEIDERKLTRITAPTDGRVEKIYKATGDRVKKGEAVADLYSPDLVVTAREFLDAQRKDNPALLQAARERFRLWGVDDDTIAQMVQSGKPISRLTVHSPVDGVVVRTHRIRGDQAKAGDPLYDVADLSAADPREQPAAERGAEPAKVQALLKERLATLQ